MKAADAFCCVIPGKIATSVTDPALKYVVLAVVGFDRMLDK